jgi:alkylation response protein AidB-like acyl-CoA dehydrogenase
MAWFAALTTAVYLGVADRALSEAVAHLDGGSGDGRGSRPVVEEALGRVVTGVLTVDAACRELCRTIDAGDTEPHDLMALATAVKHQSVPVLRAAVSDLAELVGGASLHEGGPTSRAWRDVQAVHFHPPTRLVSAGLCARWLVGRPWRWD